MDSKTSAPPDKRWGRWTCQTIHRCHTSHSSKTSDEHEDFNGAIILEKYEPSLCFFGFCGIEMKPKKDVPLLFHFQYTYMTTA